MKRLVSCSASGIEFRSNNMAFSEEMEAQESGGGFKPTPSELWSAAFSRTQPIWGGEDEVMLPVTGGADVDSGLTLEQDKYLFFGGKTVPRSHPLAVLDIIVFKASN